MHVLLLYLNALILSISTPESNKYGTADFVGIRLISLVALSKFP